VSKEHLRELEVAAAADRKRILSLERKLTITQDWILHAQLVSGT
jgi:hypothetical protein